MIGVGATGCLPAIASILMRDPCWMHLGYVTLSPSRLRPYGTDPAGA